MSTAVRRHAAKGKAAPGPQTVNKRLQTELMNMMKNPVDSVSAFPDGDNLFKWIASIKGVDGTVRKFNVFQEITKEIRFTSELLCKVSATSLTTSPFGLYPLYTLTDDELQIYEGLEFKLSLEFGPTYPLAAPVCRFETPCFHPNVDQSGNICLDILKDNWSPVQTVSSVLLSIQALLGDPNNSSPYNTHAADLWDRPDEFKKALMARYQEVSTSTAVASTSK